MQHASKWFLKTRLQEQQLLAFPDSDPTENELTEAANLLSSHFPHLDVSRIATVLFRNMNRIVDSRIIPPFAYEQVSKIDLELGQKLNYINLNRKLKKVKKEVQSEKIQTVHYKVKIPDSQSGEGRLGPIQRNFKIKNSTPPVFQDEEDNDRYQVKQVIIDAFIQRGYGMGPFRQHVTNIGYNKRVEYKKYAGIVTSIATEAFRAIQKFLECHCGILVESLPKPDIRILYSILLNFREYSKPSTPNQEYFNNYSLFLRAAYNKAPEQAQVQALSVYRTYQCILKLLMIRAKEVDPVRYEQREKISVFRQDKDKLFCKKLYETTLCKTPINFKTNQQHQKQTDSTNEDGVEQIQNSISEFDNDQEGSQVVQKITKRWDDGCEDELAAYFSELQDYSKVRQRYRQVYGSITMFENLNTLRSFVSRIIRKSLRRAQKIVRVYSGRFHEQVVQVINLRQDEKIVQYVLTSPQFLHARILLCTLHNIKEKNFALIEEIAKALIRGINSRCDMGRPRMRRYY